MFHVLRFMFYGFMVSDFKKNKNKNAFSSILFKLGAVLILIVAVLLVIADIKVYQKKKQLNAQIENLENKIAELKKENENLEKSISNIDDKNNIEKIAREELNLQKPGESVISFVTAETEQTNESTSQKNFFQNWLAWIGGIFKK